MTNYGFVIDNRKCIGCHACTVACKAEHDVPVGVNRTWVKYVEKGTYPSTRRLFSVMRCNHCEDAPCVEICPVTALYIRDDGIVDFEGLRCIACKSCMQACPYDALYIDPNTHTAAKCNYCSNRVELGLEPACVVVCPERAIIPGDLNNPKSEISQLISLETVTVRKPEKGTVPNVFYIEGDSIMLTPSETKNESNFMWSKQDAGVGHYAGKLDFLSDTSDSNGSEYKRVYDAPDKGLLWGWQVPAYLLTKAIGAGLGLLLSLTIIGTANDSAWSLETGFVARVALIALISLTLTAVFLVLDLDQPKRFHTVLLRPNWSSWLARGAYIITIYGGLLTFVLLISALGNQIPGFIGWLTLIFAFLGSVYTAFLFAQAKSRDFWQSPLLPFEMIIHSLLTGSAFYYLILKYLHSGSLANITIYSDPIVNLDTIFIGAAISTILFAVAEVTIHHPTADSDRVAKELRQGKWAPTYWTGVVFAGIGPLFIGSTSLIPIVPVVAIIGVWLLNRAWVYAPQEVKLS
ncbi:MAG: 4Fe-4S dicluster domain-containing protein [Candidatus Kariarchaeaceae archaeon]|jgi:Fe-S-cluster-containing dehydrogenase component/formate-dependent nitrite reductase membrane component NrfD